MKDMQMNKFKQVEELAKELDTSYDMDTKKLRARALLGLPITAKEEAIFLLFVATYEEAMLYLDYKKKYKGGANDCN